MTTSTFLRNYFAGILPDTHISELCDHRVFKSYDKNDIRSLKFDLSRNKALREKCIDNSLSIDKLLSLSKEERANEDVRAFREKVRQECTHSAVYVPEEYDDERIKSLINFIEDP